MIFFDCDRIKWIEKQKVKVVFETMEFGLSTMPSLTCEIAPAR